MQIYKDVLNFSALKQHSTYLLLPLAELKMCYYYPYFTDKAQRGIIITQSTYLKNICAQWTSCITCLLTHCSLFGILYLKKRFKS